MQGNEVKIQAYSKLELATLYKVSRKTLYRWLCPFNQEIGEYRGRCFTPKQIELIFKKLGYPYS